MIGDNIEIIVVLKNHSNRLDLQFCLDQVLENLIKDVKIEVKQNDVESKDDNSCLAEILLYFENDYDIAANLGVNYFYEDSTSKTIKVLSIAAMNHPAGELMTDLGENICENLSQNNTKLVLLVNDSPYQSLETLTRYYLDKNDDCGIVKAWD